MSQAKLRVRDLMQISPIIVPPDTPIHLVLQSMNDARAGSVLIDDGHGKLLGIFTERDLLRRLVVTEKDWKTLPVKDWMTENPHTISPDVGWEDAVNEMHSLRVRHLPVVENEQVVGILSTRLLMSRRTEYLNQRIEQRTLELRMANEQLMARDAEFLYNLRAAGRLQNRLLLPHIPPDWPQLHWAIHYKPLDHLGGDYYDYAKPDNDHLGLLIADASGHSVAAAMVAIMTRFIFDDVSSKTDDPGLVLTEMNHRLQGVTEDRFVTAFYCMLNRKELTLSFANAGHPYPLHLQASTGRVRPLVAQGFLLGIIPDEVYSVKDVALSPGDVLCFYTDGLMESMNEIGEQFGMDRMTEILESDIHATPEQYMERILAKQQEFCGNVASTDDVTLVICRVGDHG